MCGRYSLTTAPEALRRLFNFVNRPNLAPRYNIAPTQDVACVRVEDGARMLVLLRWGLVPHWADDLSIGSRMINARAETVADKPGFRDAFRHRRCLVLADGFYEWRTEKGRKQPYRVGRADGAPFAFAGLWERWRPKEGGEAVDTCTILTTDANEKVRPIHTRMPVILPEAYYETWLATPAEEARALMPLLGPYPAEATAFYRVSTRVNNVRNDDPDCIAPLDAAAE